MAWNCKWRSSKIDNLNDNFQYYKSDFQYNIRQYDKNVGYLENVKW